MSNVSFFSVFSIISFLEIMLLMIRYALTISWSVLAPVTITFPVLNMLHVTFFIFSPGSNLILTALYFSGSKVTRNILSRLNFSMIFLRCTVELSEKLVLIICTVGFASFGLDSNLSTVRKSSESIAITRLQSIRLEHPAACMLPFGKSFTLLVE